MHRVVRLALVATLVGGFGFVAAGPAHADEIRDQQWYLEPLGFQQAWQTTRGKGQSICIVDTGVDPQVPDLGNNVVTRSTVFDPYPGPNGTIDSHGTAVAAFAAGRGHGPNRSEGVIGAAPQASILSALANSDDKYSGAASNDSQISNAVRWCADNGASVINMSFAVPNDDAGRITAAVRYARSKDVVLVAAAGNTFEPISKTTLSYPARLPGVVAVTGINRTLAQDGGAITSSSGKPVSISAPNTTTDGTSGYPQIGLPAPGDRDDVENGKSYDLHGDGTSFSAPIVAGTVALIRAAAPRLSADQAVKILLDSATPRGAGHPNRTYGYGIVDPERAVADAVATTRPATTDAPSSTAASSASGAITAPSSSPAAGRGGGGDGLAGKVGGGAVGLAVVFAAGAAAFWRRRPHHRQQHQHRG